MAHGKNLESLAKDRNSNRTRKNSINEGSTHKGLKSLTKEGRKMLEGYQHLFYALQTNPVYLSKLLFLIPQSRSNKFLENVILTLFNFGSNMREEYLLLKLFGTALQEEIRCVLVTSRPSNELCSHNHSRFSRNQKRIHESSRNLYRVLSIRNFFLNSHEYFNCNLTKIPVDSFGCIQNWRNILQISKVSWHEIKYYDIILFQMQISKAFGSCDGKPAGIEDGSYLRKAIERAKSFASNCWANYWKGSGRQEY